jgi:hypothetical protein
MHNGIRRTLAGVAFAAFLTASPAWANYTCGGPVSGVQISPAGVVSAESYAGLSWVHLCSVEVTTNGVAPATCKAIYSLLLTAQTTGKSVLIWFNDDPNTCASHTPWTWLTGWYFGPMLQD